MDELRQQVLTYLRQHHVMTLATVSATGVWATAVFYVSDGFDLYFLSAAHTRHAQSFLFEPRIAVAIQEDYHDWQAIKGIQCEGVVSQLQGDARQAAIARYEIKYPFLQQAPAKIAVALRKVNWYCLRPERLYFIDNSKGFGYRDEIPIEGSPGALELM